MHPFDPGKAMREFLKRECGRCRPSTLLRAMGDKHRQGLLKKRATGYAWPAEEHGSAPKGRDVEKREPVTYPRRTPESGVYVVPMLSATASCTHAPP